MAEIGGNRAAGEQLAALRDMALGVDRDGGPERRHETLMERAETWGLARADAEAAYALAEEEGLEPELGLLLVASGVGVRELEDVQRDPADAGTQAAPPDWVAEGEVGRPAAQRERRLRNSFRRLRALYADAGSAAEAVELLTREPDVIEGAY